MKVSDHTITYNSRILNDKGNNDYESNSIFPSNYFISKFTKINSRLRTLKFLKGIFYRGNKSNNLNNLEMGKIRLARESNSKIKKTKRIYRHESIFKNKGKLKLNDENFMFENPFQKHFKTIKRKSEIYIPIFSNIRQIRKVKHLNNYSKEALDQTQDNILNYHKSEIKEFVPLDFIYVANCLNTSKKLINIQTNNNHYNERLNIYPSNSYTKRYSHSFELFSKSHSFPRIDKNNNNFDSENIISIKGKTVNNVKEISKILKSNIISKSKLDISLPQIQFINKTEEFKNIRHSLQHVNWFKRKFKKFE